MNKKDNMPDIVYLGLVGINTKKTAQAYMYLCIAIAIGCLLYGFINPWFFFGVPMIGASVWYHHCIKWVDNNSSWNS